MVISTFTVTADRAKQVRFIEPYYYSAGAQLFIPKRSYNKFAQRAEEGSIDWDSLIGDDRLCIVQDYFYAPRLGKSIKKVELRDTDAIINAVRGGVCSMLMQDSAF